MQVTLVWWVSFFVFATSCFAASLIGIPAAVSRCLYKSWSFLSVGDTGVFKSQNHLGFMVHPMPVPCGRCPEPQSHHVQVQISADIHRVQTQP